MIALQSTDFHLAEASTFAFESSVSEIGFSPDFANVSKYIYHLALYVGYILILYDRHGKTAASEVY